MRLLNAKTPNGMPNGQSVLPSYQWLAFWLVLYYWPLSVRIVNARLNISLHQGRPHFRLKIAPPNVSGLLVDQKDSTRSLSLPVLTSLRSLPAVVHLVLRNGD